MSSIESLQNIGNIVGDKQVTKTHNVNKAKFDNFLVQADNKCQNIQNTTNIRTDMIVKHYNIVSDINNLVRASEGSMLENVNQRAFCAYNKSKKTSKINTIDDVIESVVSGEISDTDMVVKLNNFKYLVKLSTKISKMVKESFDKITSINL